MWCKPTATLRSRTNRRHQIAEIQLGNMSARLGELAADLHAGCVSGPRNVPKLQTELADYATTSRSRPQAQLLRFAVLNSVRADRPIQVEGHSNTSEDRARRQHGLNGHCNFCLSDRSTFIPSWLRACPTRFATPVPAVLPVFSHFHEPPASALSFNLCRGCITAFSGFPSLSLLTPQSKKGCEASSAIRPQFATM